MKVLLYGLFILSLFFPKQIHSKILNIGHRGACGHAPENTLKSFQIALDMGVDAIEFDVQMSKDGHVIVIHDDDVDRTTNGTGLVKNKNLKELKLLNAGDNEQIPTLEETLDLIDRKAIAIIELKGPNTALPVAAIIHHYVHNKGWSYDNFFITTFNHQELLKLKNVVPHVKTCAAYDLVPFELAKTPHKFGVYALTILDSTIDENFINDAHERGLKIFLAVFNYSPENVAYIKQLNIDGFYLDYPEKINEFIGGSNETI